MPIVPRFTRDDIEREVARQAQAIETAIIKRLRYLGEECVRVAREEGSYMDQTGNLRNSVGYVVYSKGEKIFENFKDVAQGNGGSEVDAEAIGRRHAETKAAELAISNDYILIVVAGMDYASVVESHGRDVLTSAEQYAEQKLPSMIAKLKANINAAQ